jgi:hypothetical protein
MKYVLLLLTLSITLLSCSKDADDGAAKTDALTTGTWKLTGYMTDYDKDGTYEEDSYAILAGCEKDNIYTFQPDGTEIVDEGPTKCIANNPQTRTFTWSFNDNQKELQLGTSTYQIEELTATTLRLKRTTSYNVIYTINIKTTFTKQ